MSNVEIVSTDKLSISCNGYDQLLDHPLIYLNIDKDKKFTICPYCNKKFVFQTS